MHATKDDTIIASKIDCIRSLYEIEKLQIAMVLTNQPYCLLTAPPEHNLNTALLQQYNNKFEADSELMNILLARVSMTNVYVMISNQMSDYKTLTTELINATTLYRQLVIKDIDALFEAASALLDPTELIIAVILQSTARNSTEYEALLSYFALKFQQKVIEEINNNLTPDPIDLQLSLLCLNKKTKLSSKDQEVYTYILSWLISEKINKKSEGINLEDLKEHYPSEIAAIEIELDALTQEFSQNNKPTLPSMP